MLNRDETVKSVPKPEGSPLYSEILNMDETGKSVPKPEGSPCVARC
jgi:hypothetical protein